MFSGFDARKIEVPGAQIHTRVSVGDGPPVLLLHGYPQTHAMWHHLAPTLAATGRSVVVTDLRGYGDSQATSSDFTFRAMAADQVEVMRQLGFTRFDVVGHDRGARTAHRMTLDHPQHVRSVALLDILPTLDVWRTMDDWLATRYYHWVFLIQPGGLPQRLINAEPLAFLHAALGGLARAGQDDAQHPDPDSRERQDSRGALGIFDPQALAEYERAAVNPDVVAAWCADYQAAATDDVLHDRDDEGRTSDIPCLVLWGRHGVVGARHDPIAAWRRRFPQATGAALNTGHFLAEECPDDVALTVLAHLAVAD